MGWWVLPLVGPSVPFYVIGGFLASKDSRLQDDVIVTMVSGHTTETIKWLSSFLACSKP